MLALTLGRPLGIDDRDCDVELPVDVDDEYLSEYFAGANMPRNTPFLMRGFLELVGLYGIAGKVLRQVYSLDKCKEHLEPEKRAELNRSVETLDKELVKWCEDLPNVFKTTPINEKHVSMAAVLCTHYYSILLTLHRNFLPVKPDQPILPRSTAKAVSTARACIRLAPSIRNVVPACYHLAFFIQNLFSSAVIILLYSMHTTDLGASQMAMEEAKSCLGILETWDGHWPGARKCKELLEDLAATASEAISALQQNNQTQGAPPPPASASPSNVPSGPTSPISSMADARMSAPTNMSMSNSDRMKNKARRNRSRDVRLSPRLVPQSGYHRHDREFCLTFQLVLGSDKTTMMIALSQRARSTSRKRPHDDDYQDFGNPSLSSVLSGSYQTRANLSAHSSPVSAHSHPSPPSRLDPPLEASPPNVPISSFNLSLPPQSPTAMQGTSSSSRFTYDYIPQSPTDNRWTSSSEVNGSKLYDRSLPSSSSVFGSTSAFGLQQTTSVDSTSSYLPYDAADPTLGLSSLSTVPELSDFAGPGLPFRGLDYIRNYNPGGYALGADQDGLWQTFDPGAFGLDPEIPFTLNDLSVDGQDTSIEWTETQ